MQSSRRMTTACLLAAVLVACASDPGRAWADTQTAYRERLFGVGGAPRDHAAHIPPEQVQKIFAAGGILPLAILLRCRLKYFTHGAILGSRAFVAAHTPSFARHRQLRVVPRWSDAEFTVLRAVRSPAIG